MRENKREIERGEIEKGGRNTDRKRKMEKIVRERDKWTREKERTRG